MEVFIQPLKFYYRLYKKQIHMKYLTTFLSCVLLAAVGSSAQSIGPATLNITGGSSTNNGNTYEFAIGSVVSGNTYISTNLIVTPGVLQPETSDPDGIELPEITAGELSVYPNPVTQTLFLQPHFDKGGTLEYVLYDVAGRTITRQTQALPLGNEKQEIRMAAYATGQYILQIRFLTPGKTSINAYKIQKVN